MSFSKCFKGSIFAGLTTLTTAARIDNERFALRGDDQSHAVAFVQSVQPDAQDGGPIDMDVVFEAAFFLALFSKYEGKLDHLKALHAKNPCIVNVKHDGLTIAHVAVMAGQLDVLQWSCKQNSKLINATTDEGGTLAHLAAQFADPTVLQWIFDQDENFDIACKDNDGATVGHLAAKNTKKLSLKNAMQNLKFVEVLHCVFERKDGAQLINVPDKRGIMPFQHAVSRDPNQYISGTHFARKSFNLLKQIINL